MTIPAAYCLAVDLHGRRSQAGDDGGCPLRPASPQINHRSPDNRTSRRDLQPRPHPIGNQDCLAPGRPAQSDRNRVTPKSP
jgi:hypothetical protein